MADVSVLKEVFDNSDIANVVADSEKQTRITDVKTILTIRLPGFGTLFNKTTFFSSVLF